MEELIYKDKDIKKLAKEFIELHAQEAEISKRMEKIKKTLKDATIDIGLTDDNGEHRILVVGDYALTTFKSSKSTLQGDIVEKKFKITLTEDCYKKSVSDSFKAREKTLEDEVLYNTIYESIKTKKDE